MHTAPHMRYGDKRMYYAVRIRLLSGALNCPSHTRMSHSCPSAPSTNMRSLRYADLSDTRTPPLLWRIPWQNHDLAPKSRKQCNESCLPLCGIKQRQPSQGNNVVCSRRFVFSAPSGGPSNVGTLTGSGITQALDRIDGGSQSYTLRLCTITRAARGYVRRTKDFPRFTDVSFRRVGPL